MAAAIAAQITSSPIPAPIVKRGISVEIKDLLRLPDTRGMRPADQDVNPSGWARISYVRDLADGRRFVNDSRGIIYDIGANNQPQIYLNFATEFPNANFNRLKSGLIGFVFHPEFLTICEQNFQIVRMILNPTISKIPAPPSASDHDSN